MCAPYEKSLETYLMSLVYWLNDILAFSTILFVTAVLEFVNSVVNVCSYMKLCRYPPPLLYSKWDPPVIWSTFFLGFFQHKALLSSLFFAFFQLVNAWLFAFDFRHFFFLKQGGLSQRPIRRFGYVSFHYIFFLLVETIILLQANCGFGMLSSSKESWI